MRFQKLFYWLSFAVLAVWLMSAGGCAQIGFPTGGIRDSIPPILLSSTPASGSTGFSSRKVTLLFNEYVEVKDIQKNLMISPAMSVNPVVSSKLKTVTIQFKDSLRKNTTYTIQLGDAIRDINEGNALGNFNYIFSTGDEIDSLIVSGKVILAETGEYDSTLMVFLFSNQADSAIEKSKPEFITRLNGSGEFVFKNLPSGAFRLYALKDGDGSRNYNNPSEFFAFYDSMVYPSVNPTELLLFAYQKEKLAATPLEQNKSATTKLTLYPDLPSGYQSLIDSLKFSFSRPIARFNPDSIQLLDSVGKKVDFKDQFDASRKTLKLAIDWKPGVNYKLIINKGAFSDSSGNELSRNDTIAFSTRANSFYGRMALRFPGYQKEKNQVLQLLDKGQVRFSFILSSSNLKRDLIPPGEYSMRILLDQNGNGIWDPGDFSKKRQPERCLQITEKLIIRSDWDNERDISF